jgi:succinate dehydrogenase / fumarate reductase iron-sulfur subunit
MVTKKKMTLHLRIWRQPNSHTPGKFVTYTVRDVSPDMSLLELLDVLNEQLIKSGELPVEFDSDCREGICGTCGFLVNGVAHGPKRGRTACQQYLRDFKDGETITLEPFRAKAFPVIKDLVVIELSRLGATSL